MSARDDKEILAKAGFGHRVGFGEAPAVLVVDLSRGFTDPTCAAGSDLDDVVAATSRLLEAAHAADVPAIFTTIYYEEGLKDAGVWLKKAPGLAALTADSGWGEIDPRLPRRPEDPVVVKKGASAFFGTNVAAILAAERVDTVLLCGATTSGCIRASAVDAMQYGYRCVVPRECVGDRTVEPHAANLFDIDSKYGDVVDLDEVIAYLESRGAAA